MPTPNGVNYLLQFLLLLSNSPIIEQQESKVDVLSYVLLYFSQPIGIISFEGYTFISLFIILRKEQSHIDAPENSQSHHGVPASHSLQHPKQSQY